MEHGRESENGEKRSLASLNMMSSDTKTNYIRKVVLKQFFLQKLRLHASFSEKVFLFPEMVQNL